MTDILLYECEYVPMELWGQDHWSTLMYLEVRAVDHSGIIDNHHMRCNPRLHRGLAHEYSEGEYPTRLKDSVELDNHDDWSCIEDMEAEGLVRTEEARGYNVVVSLTDRGFDYASQLRKHRARGGSVKEFEPMTRMDKLKNAIMGVFNFC